MPSEIRKDYIDDTLVIVSDARGKRPHEFPEPERKPGGTGPFCPDALPEEQIIKTYRGHPWEYAVIENKFPFLSPEADAYGHQELLVESPRHDIVLADLNEARFADIFEIYRERILGMFIDPRIRSVLVFKNQGERAGASIDHAHSQIIATEVMPPAFAERARRLRAYQRKHGACQYCDILKQEARSERLVYKDRYVMAFAPYASRYKHEVWVFPRKHREHFGDLTETERRAFASAVRRLLKKVKKLGVGYNYELHEVREHAGLHTHMRITPRENIHAGFELASGMIVNPVSPEAAAKFYRGGKGWTG